jgi:hypothetical protein
MGSLSRRVAQGIKIKTQHPPTIIGADVVRKSRVKVEAERDAVKLAVRIRADQEITKFILGVGAHAVDMLDANHPYAADVQTELESLPRFQCDGEKWIAWRVSKNDLPHNLANFRTEFGLSNPDTDGQTVMWAVVYETDPNSFGGEHVFVGYADVSP